MPFFNESKQRSVKEYFLDIVLSNIVFDNQLFNYIRQPYETVYIHKNAPILSPLNDQDNPAALAIAT